MKIVLVNLGCKVNQYEIDAIFAALSKQFEVTQNLEYADYYIVNTCAVTSEAEKKSRQYISKILKINKNAKIIICGCSSQNNPSQFLNKNVVLVLGTANKGKILNYIMQNKTGNLVEAISKEYEDDLMQSSAQRTRAYLKIQDGCNNYCSYCLIPYVRGTSRSRALKSIVCEARQLCLSTAEIVLTGINMSDYQIDGQLALTHVMRALSDLPVRIRISSLEVNVVTEEFLTALKAMPNFCPHFHLSLQSGSNQVLKAMNRHYTAEEYLQKVDLIKKYFNFASITTDIIVGFPTETDDDFKQTLQVVSKAGFFKVHYFAYSSRTGTVASKRYCQLNGKLIKAREQQLSILAQKTANNYLKTIINNTLEVLVEENIDNYATGFSKEYIRCYLAQSPNLIGKITKVKPIEIFKDGFLCRQILEEK